MKEIELDKLENWYTKELKKRFKKEHKVLKKLFSIAERHIAETINSFKSWLNPNRNNDPALKLDEKNQKIMERFVEKMVQTLENIKVPTVHTEISYESSQRFVDDVKKLVMIYNQQGKKSIPRFAKQLNLELKEAELNLRKIMDISQKISNFLRKNYADGKNAENLIKKVPLLKNEIERLAQTKASIDDMEKRYKNMQQELKSYEEELYKILKDPLLEELQKVESKEAERSRKLRDELKFQKAFKKLKKGLEKGTIIARGIQKEHIQPYLKDPITTILSEGPKINRLKEVLIKTRILLEDEDDPLNMKADLRHRIIENINAIVSHNSLEEKIKELIELREQKKKLRQLLVEKGIEKQRKELKTKIATLTVDLEHFKNDLNKRKREYHDLLEKIAKDRDALQKSIKNETGQDVKLKIYIPTQ